MGGGVLNLCVGCTSCGIRSEYGLPARAHFIWALMGFGVRS